MISRNAWIAMVAFFAVLCPVGAVYAANDETSERAIVLVLDEDALDAGQAPNNLSMSDLSAEFPTEGLRAPMPYFAANVGGHLTLPMGSAEDAGWFAFDGAPASWAEQETDSFRNYLQAAPGLGSPDADGNPSSLLADVQGLRAIDADGLQAFGENAICSVVYDGDVTTHDTGGNLEGATLGIAAFRVLSVSWDENGAPSVEIEILDPATVCSGVLGSGSNSGSGNN